MLVKIIKIIIIFAFIQTSLISPGYTQSLLLTPEYLSVIQDKISSCFIYPQEAILKGWEGIVKVRFIVADDGRLKDIDIAESSGYPLLDAVAVLAIKDASPYPFPEGYPLGQELEIILPVNYRQPESTPTSSLLPSVYELSTANSLSTKALEQESALAKQEQEQVKETPEIPLAQEQQAQEAIGLVTQLLTPFPLPSAEEETGGNILSTKNRELADFVELALKNNQPTKVAREEVEFAQLKVSEAKRNFYPAFKIQTYMTEGDVYKIDYEERESKLQIDQPIFYGTRLKDSLKQAETNLEINKKNYDRLKLDVVQKTETAYYNLITSRMLLEQQEKVYQEAEGLLGKIEKLADMEMIIPLEANSARSWLEQIKFQMDSTKQDLYMAELTFKQVMNCQEVPVMKTQLFEPKRLNIDFDYCLEAAMKYRPEIYLSELLVKFNDYGQKIEASKNTAFTVDFTGSVAQYKGHYKTEPWQDSSNWYVGFKVNKPWGASTLNTSLSSEETQPRFGQTSATASSTISSELNLFDNLKRISDKKRTDIDFHRSISDFDEALKTVSFEVQDAFLNYQKAILQFNTAASEMKYRRNELKVTKIRALVGETTLATAMSSLVSYSEALTRFMQALANYHISLANLRKTTGYGIEI